MLTEIGEVTAKAKFDATDNYLASEKDLTITVTKKQASVPPISTAKPVVYGVTLANVALSDPNWKWVDNTIKPTV
ncbi:MAG: hypothetical protein PUI58_08705, partial [Solobacterium sp.]|nr:hypothetical protein [Solobacterium sp.]